MGNNNLSINLKIYNPPINCFIKEDRGGTGNITDMLGISPMICSLAGVASIYLLTGHCGQSK